MGEGEIMKSLDWDDLRVLLAVARAGRFSAASQRLQYDHSTIARRIDRLEQALNSAVFHRTPFGVSLTAEGSLILAYAERIENKIIEVTEASNSYIPNVAGSVRVAAPEALGVNLIIRNLPSLHKKYPNIRLELVPDGYPISISKREVDILISFQRPANSQLRTRKLSGYTLGLYATQNYLTKHGTPRSIHDLRHHVLLWTIESQRSANETAYLNQIVAHTKKAFRSTSIIALQNATSSGLGIGLLHRSSACQDDRLISILPKVSIDRAYWIALCEVNCKVPRIQAVLTFLEEIVKRNCNSPASGKLPASA